MSTRIFTHRQTTPIAGSSGTNATAVSAADPEVTVRFVHEDAISSGQKEWLSGVDFIDLQPCSEEISKARGKANMLQLQLQPTIHHYAVIPPRSAIAKDVGGGG